MNTQTHRIVSVLMIVLMVAVAAAAWFLVAQPQLSAAAQSNEELSGVQSRISTSQASLDRLRKGEDDLPELNAQLASLQQSIPSALESSPLVSGIDAQAAAAGVFVKSITVDDPAAYAPPPAPAVPSASTPTGGATPAPTPTASATPAATGAAAGKSQYTAKTDPLITASNFVTVPVSITVTGNWDQTLAFMKNLQTGTRLYAVGTVGSKASDDGSYETVVAGYIFAILDPSSQAAAAKKAVADAARPTPTSTATHKPAPTASTAPIPSGSSTQSGTPSR